MRRLITVLGIVIVLVAISVPALSHNVSWTLRETGFTECTPPDRVNTRIVAKAHQRHTQTGVVSFDFHFPNDGVYYGQTVYWSWLYVMNWGLRNQTGYAFDYSGSYGFCN